MATVDVLKTRASSLQVGAQYFRSVVKSSASKVVKLRPLKATLWDFEGNICATKCLDPDTILPLYDASHKAAKDILVGDLLLGDDSTPRRVLSICSGQDEMFKLVPARGDAFTVNSRHILTLRCPYTPVVSVERAPNSAAIRRYRVGWFTVSGMRSKSFTVSILGEEAAREAAEQLRESLRGKADVFDMPLNQFILQSQSWRGKCQLFRVGFDWAHQSVPIDPWILGYWIGDGHSAGARITTTDPEVVREFERYAPTIDCIITHAGDNIAYGITGMNRETCVYGTNPFMNSLRDLELVDNKHIPKIYLLNDRDTRLRLLAGLIDSDGTLQKHGFFLISQKSTRVAYDIAFLARSLGFFVNIRQYEALCTNNGVWGLYWFISICGDTLDEIPVILPRKKCHRREQNYSAMVSTFTVESIGRGAFCGFELDGNHRFLLGDFTVTHNSTKGDQLSTELNESSGFKCVFNKERMNEMLLDQFYKNPAKYGFMLQIYAATQCNSMHIKAKYEARDLGKMVIVDRGGWGMCSAYDNKKFLIKTSYTFPYR